ncbi:MAG: hypothetical protein AAF840_18395, partial [Bacteroidota bacterium]
LPLGNFAPIIDLVAPQQQQLIALGGEYRFRGQGSLRLEGARSKLDLNRFSREDAADDLGSALRFDADRVFPLGSDTSGWQLAGRGHYEFLERTFNAINPYRSPEFFRNWNLSNRLGTVQPTRENEQILGAGIGLVKKGVGQINYDYEQFLRGESYTGRRHAAALRVASAGWLVDGQLSLLQSADEVATGSFQRPSLKVSKTFERLGGWTLRTAYQGERSERREASLDTLLGTSFQFDRYTLGLVAPSNEQYAFSLSANQRTDLLPKRDALITSTEAREITAEGSFTASREFKVGGNFTFRDLKIADPELVDDTPNRTFLGRLDVRTNAIKRSLRAQTTYQVGSGQEPRVDFQYLYVGPGQGQYIWQDSLYNNDGR